MNNIPKLFRKYTLSEASKRLGVLPIHLARYLGQGAGMPARLQFDDADIEKFHVEMELKIWWSPDKPFFVEDNNIKRQLIRELSYRIIENGLTHPQRYDSLLRGLVGEEQVLLRRYINLLVKNKMLKLTHGVSSQDLQIFPDKRQIIEDIAYGRQYPNGLEQLWSD